MSPTALITDALRDFDGLPLAALEARANLLARVESKFIVSSAVMEAVLREARGHFDVLEIDGSREFGYDTRYFDDDGYGSYFAHHQDRRRRFKVRVRTYLHSRTTFAEIKLKWRRGLTVKRRFPSTLAWTRTSIRRRSRSSAGRMRTTTGSRSNGHCGRPSTSATAASRWCRARKPAV
jgi:hypothetical protein